MPYAPYDPGPQRASPKSLAAVQAESKQAKAVIEDPDLPDQPPIAVNPGKTKNPFIKKISIAKWKVNAKEIAKKLTKSGM